LPQTRHTGESRYPEKQAGFHLKHVSYQASWLKSSEAFYTEISNGCEKTLNSIDTSVNELSGV